MTDLRDTDLAAGTAGPHDGAAVMCVDHEGRLTVWSGAAERLYGYSGTEVLGRSLTLLDPVEGGPDPAPEVVRALRGEAVEPCETRRRRRDGTMVPVEVTITPVVGDDGEVVAAAVVHRDLTVAQDHPVGVAQARHEAELQSLLEGIDATLSRWGADRRMQLTSRSVGRVEDADVTDLVGLTAEDMGYEPAELAKWNAAFDEVLASARPVEYETRLDLPGGPVWWSCRLTPDLDDRGEVVGVLSLLTDVSARARAAAELSELTDQYRLIAENASDVVVRASAHGVIEWISPSIAEMAGWDPGELVGVDFIDLVDPADHPEVRATRVALAGGGRQRLTFRLRCRDGSVRWCEANVRPVLDDTGRVIGRIGSWRDIESERSARLQLEESEARFRQAMTNTPVGMCVAGPDGRFEQVNPALCDALGRDEEDLVRRTWQEVTHPDDIATDAALVAEVLAGRRDSYRLLKRYLRPDGATVWGELSVAAVRDDTGAVKYFICQVLDVTDRMLAEKSLADSEALLRTVIESTDDSILHIAPDGRVDMVNQRVLDRSGTVLEDWIGNLLSEVGDLFGPADGHQAEIAAVLATGRAARYEFEAAVAGEQRWFQALATPAVDPAGARVGVVVSARDVTEQMRTEAELVQLATKDSLTGLANRSELVPELTRALGAAARSGRWTAVLLLDLDRFKVVNDSLGHEVGDQVLDAAARRLEATVRDSDLVVRAGGDEFVVVMRDIEDPSDVVRAAWRIVHAFRSPFTVAGADLYATASIGVSLSSDRSEPGDMVREGDTAMYVAKRAGGDRVAVFNEELRDAVTARLTLESDLRPALDRDELSVWFQPEVDLATGTIVAAEALLRWRHPGGEIWTADRFVEVAEEAGLMVDIGAWVLRTACDAAASWRRRHPDRELVIRVNLSALQLVDDDLLAIVDDALERSGIPPSSLCVEITETALLRSTSVMRSNFAGLHARGIQIASDDFGTGYASLAYLHDYPIDVVKIDRSFIIDLTSDESDARLVAGTIALAGHLDMSVTAEGVETPQQAALLRGLGCPSAQGYLFSPAIPGEDFERLLEHTFPTG